MPRHKPHRDRRPHTPPASDSPPDNDRGSPQAAGVRVVPSGSNALPHAALDSQSASKDIKVKHKKRKKRLSQNSPTPMQDMDMSIDSEAGDAQEQHIARDDSDAPRARKKKKRKHRNKVPVPASDRADSETDDESPGLAAAVIAGSNDDSPSTESPVSAVDQTEYGFLPERTNSPEVDSSGSSSTDDDADDVSSESSQSESDSAEIGSPMSKPSSASSSLTTSPASSPLKPRAWKSPVGGGIASSTGDNSMMVSKQYHVKALILGDTYFATNSSGRTARKYALLFDLDTENLMVLVAYADDATKFMENIRTGRCYTVDLTEHVQTPGRSLCVPSHLSYFRLAANSKIRPYTPAKGQPDLQEKYHKKTIRKVACVDIASLVDAPFDSFVNVAGLIMSSRDQPFNGGQGVKIGLTDGTGAVSIMFFEGHQNLTVGSSVVLIGAKVWKNKRTDTKELSIYSSSLIATNQIHMPSHLAKLVQHKRFDGLVMISAVPSTTVRSVRAIQAEAAKVKHDTETVTGTVLLRLDPRRQAQTGSITYNGCVVCRKKVKPTGNTDENNNQLFEHEKEGGDTHLGTSYECHYLFNGRFLEPDNPQVYMGRVDNIIGNFIFGMTADEMTSLESDDRTSVIASATAKEKKYNITVSKTGDIHSLIPVEQ